MSVETEVAALKEEVKELTGEVHTLQRQATSRRGVEGRPGQDSVVPGPRGEKGATGTIDREQALSLFREVIHEHGNELVKELVEAVQKELKKKFSEVLDDLGKVNWNDVAYGDKNPFPPKAKSAV